MQRRGEWNKNECVKCDLQRCPFSQFSGVKRRVDTELESVHSGCLNVVLHVCVCEFDSEYARTVDAAPPAPRRTVDSTFASAFRAQRLLSHLLLVFSAAPPAAPPRIHLGSQPVAGPAS